MTNHDPFEMTPRSDAVLAEMNRMALEYYGQTASAAAARGVCVKCSRAAMRPGDFRDDASRTEAANTVLCQACQDEIFGAMELAPDHEDAEAFARDAEDADDPANDRTCQECGVAYNFTYQKKARQYWDGAWNYATGCETHCLSCWLGV